MRRFRSAFRWLIVLVAIVPTVVAGFIAERLSWLPRSVAPLSGKVAVDHIDAEVRIVRDRNAVPHISGASAGDVYFGLGFAHAQDRLWQMAFYRRVLQGKLSQLIGPSGLRIDTLAHALDLEGRARDCLAHLSPHTRRVLAAYAAGVNAWAGSRHAHLPPEFHLFMTSFEPWLPEHSLLMLKFMAMDLSDNAIAEVQRARLIALLGEQAAGELFPTSPNDPITLNQAHPSEHASRLKADPLLDPLLRLRGASNNWVVGGQFTKSGKPLLANDPHLGLSAPGIWYLAHLAPPAGDAVGATIPGIPGVILGHNGHIAWGLTTAQTDTEDLVIETIHPDDPARYLTPTGSLPFESRDVAIPVRFGGAKHVTLRETRHGPVLPPVFPALGQVTPNNSVIALAATGLARDDATMEALIDMMSAEDLGAMNAAFEKYQAPMQNILYADTRGNIGFMAPARVPIRGRNAPARSIVPADGKLQDPLWVAYVPYSGLPRLLNPASGRLYTANNKPVADDYPYFLGADWPPGYRARRIGDLLSSGAPWDVADVSRMQKDERAPDAADLVPLLLRAEPAGAREAQAMKLLAAWDFEMAADRAEPLIFTAWLASFQRLILRDELGKLAGEMRGMRPVFLTRLLRGEEGLSHWCDDQETTPTETCDEMIKRALTAALDELSKAHGRDMTRWRWAEAHAARFGHQSLGGLPLIGDLFDRSIPVGGGPNSIDRGDMRYAGRRPYSNVHGAGMRASYDLSDLSRSRFMIAIGQSGNPLSPHYDDLMEAWAVGDSFEIPVDERLYGVHALGTWDLRPGGAVQFAKK